MMKVLIQCLAVGGAGFAGALARWGVGTLFGRLLTAEFPVGTFVVNISGSFFLGWFFTFIEARSPGSDTLKLAIGTGFVGAYTTFSTYMYESTDLIRKGAVLEALVNLLGSLLAGLLAVRLGIILARRV